MIIIGGSRGGREGRTPPPGRPNSFDFMQFSGKFGVFTPPLEGSRPPLGKILDPPLIIASHRREVEMTKHVASVVVQYQSQTKFGQGNVFTSVCQSFCSLGLYTP